MKIKTWDSHAVNDGLYYKATFSAQVYGLAAVSPAMSARSGRFPALGGLNRPERALDIDIMVLSSDAATVDVLAEQLEVWFDPDDETSKVLVVTDDDGTSNERYVYAICQALEHVGAIGRRKYHVTLKVDGDVLWRSVTLEDETWAVTSSGDQQVCTNGGAADAYPKLTIKPTDVKTSGLNFDYYRFIAVEWKATVGRGKYPIDITNALLDTAALVTAGKMQADGDDLRVYVNGVEANRWLNGINTSTTSVWVNLDFNGAVAMTLKTAIAGSGAITEIEVNESIDMAWATGLLQIGSEIFVFTGKDNIARKFTGVSRASKGSSMAAHNVADAVAWIQNDIVIYYGESGLSAPVVDGNYEPMFAIASSTNVSWDYNDFLDTTKPSRPGSWTPFWASSVPNSVVHYGGNEYGSFPTTYAELGTRVINGVFAGYSFTHIAGITGANFQNGEKYCQKLGTSETALVNWDAVNSGIWSYANGPSWVIEYAIAAPSTANAWEAWSQNETLATGSKGVMLLVYHQNIYPASANLIECADVTLALNASYTPVCTIGAEVANLYELDCTIENETTGEKISISYAIPLNGELEIDTYNKTVTLVADGSNQFQALTVVDGPRRDWLKLIPGANTLKYTEVGVQAVTIEVEWAKREYR